MDTIPTSTNAKQCFHTTQPFVSSFLFTVTEQRKQHAEGKEGKEEKEGNTKDKDQAAKPQKETKKRQTIIKKKKTPQGPIPPTRKNVTPF